MVAHGLAKVEIWVRLPALALVPVVPMVERFICDEEAQGSNPCRYTFISFSGVMETRNPAEVVIWVQIPVRAFSIEVFVKLIEAFITN